MRKNSAIKRDVLPDPVYNSRLVTKAINNIMHNGSKGIAQKILYQAFAIVETQTKQDPIEVFNKAIENIRPHLELKVRRIGGANYQVPNEVAPERQVTLALR